MKLWMRIVLLIALTKPSMAHSPALVITMAKKLGIYLRYENIACPVKLKSIWAKIVQLCFDYGRTLPLFYALLFYIIESVPELLGNNPIYP